MTKKDKVIKKLVRAAKQAMKQLDYAMPLTSASDAYNALHSAVEAAKKFE